jgi:hypothetical protein
VKEVPSTPRIGIWSWSFVGFVAATVIVAIALGAVSEIVLPAVFAAVLAVVFKPLVGKLERRGLRTSTISGWMWRVRPITLGSTKFSSKRYIACLRARGFLQLVADRPQPTIQKALD